MNTKLQDAAERIHIQHRQQQQTELSGQAARFAATYPTVAALLDAGGNSYSVRVNESVNTDLLLYVWLQGRDCLIGKVKDGHVIKDQQVLSSEQLIVTLADEQAAVRRAATEQLEHEPAPLFSSLFLLASTLLVLSWAALGVRSMMPPSYLLYDPMLGVQMTLIAGAIVCYALHFRQAWKRARAERQS